jgi:hypothetical protein
MASHRPDANTVAAASVAASAAPVAAGPDAARFLAPTGPLKRRRSPDSLARQNGAARGSSPPAGSPKPLSPAAPLPLTAAAEMADQKRRKIELEKGQAGQTSPNPGKAVLDLLSARSDHATSRRAAGPDAASAPNRAVAAVAPAIAIPRKPPVTTSIQTSPLSMTSADTLDSNGATAMTANGPQVASPGQMGDDDDEDDEDGDDDADPRDDARGADAEEGGANKSFTYPGPLLTAQVADGRRGMSLPGSGLRRDGSRSPPSSSKKHRCPYCSTEFTRHHNLKSHLLTHSHEKPYMCQTCDSRFRRLHDLKRHTKLHTGERPHICPKCKRSFARGDALARHAKGQGGCAGRRSSVGSYGGDGSGPGGDDGMDGLMYAGEASHEPEHLDDDTEGDERRPALPQIQRHDAPADRHRREAPDRQPSHHHARTPSTYPPVAARPAPVGGGLYPPSANHAPGSAASSPGTQPSPLPPYPPAPANPAYPATGPSAFGSMTESPKPLSPGGGMHPLGHPDHIGRNRSPSLTAQFQQQQYGRRPPHPRSTPPPIGLPPMPPMPPNPHSMAPQLPSLPGLTPPDPRFTLHSQTGAPAPSMPHPGQREPASGSYHSAHGAGGGGGPPSASNSLSSHGTAAHGSGDRGSLPYGAHEAERLWAALRDVEAKVGRLQDEVASLRGQLAVALGQQQQQQQQQQSATAQGMR